jgi:hypothetical protein
MIGIDGRDAGKGNESEHSGREGSEGDTKLGGLSSPERRAAGIYRRHVGDVPLPRSRGGMRMPHTRYAYMHKHA